MGPGLTGCDPCPQGCTLEGETLERCLSDWELTWQDFQVENRQDYVLVCRELARDDAATTPAEEDEARRNLCVERQTVLATAADCSEARVALDGI